MIEQGISADLPMAARTGRLVAGEQDLLDALLEMSRIRDRSPRRPLYEPVPLTWERGLYDTLAARLVVRYSNGESLQVPPDWDEIGMPLRLAVADSVLRHQLPTITFRFPLSELPTRKRQSHKAIGQFMEDRLRDAFGAIPKYWYIAEPDLRTRAATHVTGAAADIVDDSTPRLRTVAGDGSWLGQVIGNVDRACGGLWQNVMIGSSEDLLVETRMAFGAQRALTARLANDEYQRLEPMLH